MSTKIIKYFAVPGVGRYKAIKPPPRTAFTVFRNIRFFYRYKMYRALSLKRALSSVKKWLSWLCTPIKKRGHHSFQEPKTKRLEKGAKHEQLKKKNITAAKSLKLILATVIFLFFNCSLFALFSNGEFIKANTSNTSIHSLILDFEIFEIQ